VRGRIADHLIHISAAHMSTFLLGKSEQREICVCVRVCVRARASAKENDGPQRQREVGHVANRRAIALSEAERTAASAAVPNQVRSIFTMLFSNPAT
jgi:hypothetical protein